MRQIESTSTSEPLTVLNPDDIACQVQNKLSNKLPTICANIVSQQTTLIDVATLDNYGLHSACRFGRVRIILMCAALSQ